MVRFTGDRKREGAGGDPILATKRLGGGNSREDSATTPIDSGARFRRESGNCGPDCWRRQQWTRVGGCCVLRILTRRNPHLRIVGPWMSGVYWGLCGLGSGAFVDGAAISDGFCIGTWVSVTGPATNRRKAWDCEWAGKFGKRGCSHPRGAGRGGGWVVVSWNGRVRPVREQRSQPCRDLSDLKYAKAQGKTN